MNTKRDKEEYESKWLLISRKKKFQNEYWILKKKTVMEIKTDFIWKISEFSIVHNHEKFYYSLLL